ncbi:hypothetical protein D9611_002159 [Ephemerocybe angulata]|uniref:F-box domain-containing protein n=1 Tax=Ephemerocybe angulata TaxID=980116 RepID=A0A8H5CIL3_9AGAR|nr:hypothetical protein D9611_002159 [Tulosesus angulatus]
MASSASPTAILDDDALLSIFEFIPALEWPIARGFRGWEGLRIILPVSQVCKRWRDLAVNHSPQLWRHHALIIPPSQRLAYENDEDPSNEASDIQGDNRAIAAQHFRTELARRSQNLSLESGWEWSDYYPTPNQILSVLAYADRLKSCTLKLRCFDTPGIEGATPSINASVLEALSRCSFPVLEELTMDINYDGEKTHILPSTLFPGGLKTLKDLFLRTCWMDLRALQLGAELGWLEVTIHTLPDPQHPGIHTFPNTFQEVLDILRRLPNLLYLVLGHVPFSTVPAPAATTSPPVVLNHLFKLQMTLTAAELEVFVQQVSIPACEIVHLHVHLQAAVPDHLSCIATLVGRHVRPSGYGTQMTLFECRERHMACAAQPNDHEVDFENPKAYLEDAYRYKFWIMLAPSAFETDNIGPIFPAFLSAWEPILGDIDALIVQQGRETPSYMCRAINGFISRSRKHRMRTVVCSKDLVGVLVGETVPHEGEDHVTQDSPLNVIQVEESLFPNQRIYMYEN